MRNLVLLSATALILGLGATTGSAAPASGFAAATPAPAVVLVNGWWEQENQGDAPDRYWQLNRTDRRRYDAAEARIQHRHHRYHLDQYDHRDDRDLRQQHTILRFEWHP
jgi:hypothetical protein